MASLKEDARAGRIVVAVYMMKVVDEWLPLVDAFVAKWGSEFVPGDVRSAVNDVEAGSGLEQRTWPPFEECMLG